MRDEDSVEHEPIEHVLLRYGRNEKMEEMRKSGPIFYDIDTSMHSLLVYPYGDLYRTMARAKCWFRSTLASGSPSGLSTWTSKHK
ncbi:hypothetical protein AMTR_s00350p00011890 [Amborella trichopoda]|uniref:Uncharacterized protein n=1 Tax=Amborella trichopoda TaxID=13333 RepID=W1NST9_AMBTC|nr:hypothetical protein AMTR_s00350p00011890 [Amborella trichopoda]